MKILSNFQMKTEPKTETDLFSLCSGRFNCPGSTSNIQLGFNIFKLYLQNQGIIFLTKLDFSHAFMLIEDQYTQRMTLLNQNVLSISWRQGRRKNPVKLDGLLFSKFDEFEETGKLWLPNTTQEPQISVRSMTTDPESKITLISLMG